ncbi:hypothetical protein QOT17_015951, partial [Balamuthia mandrillaris]
GAKIHNDAKIKRQRYYEASAEWTRSHLEADASTTSWMKKGGKANVTSSSGKPPKAKWDTPRKFDPQTGEPLPKFDPQTGEQNWW